MAEKYEVELDYLGFRLVIRSGTYAGYAVARFWQIGRPHDCPNAEREAWNPCRRLNAAAKKGNGKR